MQPSHDRDLAHAQDRILAAATHLLNHDSYLFTRDLNERSISHKFAEHLQREFPEWHVDCEYNRDHHDPKRLDLPPRHDISSDDLTLRQFSPTSSSMSVAPTNNFIVIEVKKSSNPENDNWDLAKLAAFKNQLGYEVAMFFRFATDGERIGFDRQTL